MSSCSPRLGGTWKGGKWPVEWCSRRAIQYCNPYIVIPKPENAQRGDKCLACPPPEVQNSRQPSWDDATATTRCLTRTIPHSPFRAITDGKLQDGQCGGAPLHTSGDLVVISSDRGPSSRFALARTQTLTSLSPRYLTLDSFD